MDNNLFRQEALDRIESPERLNEMVKITNPKSWIVLLSFIGLVLSIIVWSIFGQLSYSVAGQGILLQSGGVQDIAAFSNGKIDQIFVEVGDYVKKGEKIALIDQPELLLKISNENIKLNDFLTRFNKIEQFGSENISLKQTLYEKEEIGLNKRIKINEEKIKFFSDKIAAQTELLEKGLITKETLYNTKNQFFNIQQENETLSNELKRLHNEMFQLTEQNEIELQKLKSEILSIENNIRELNSLYNLNSVIYSPLNGKIIEMMVNPGKVVNAGVPIMSIEPSDVSKKIEAIIYVNPRQGKKVKPGMKAKIYPSTIEVEEYGYIIGEILKVSEYPATHLGMLRTLGNDELVKSFLTNEPPIAITVSLELDSTSFSGFKWSSVQGPNQEILSGTLCSSKIIIENKRPISLIIPDKVKESFYKIKGKKNKP